MESFAHGLVVGLITGFAPPTIFHFLNKCRKKQVESHSMLETNRRKIDLRAVHKIVAGDATNIEMTETLNALNAACQDLEMKLVDEKMFDGRFKGLLNEMNIRIVHLYIEIEVEKDPDAWEYLRRYWRGNFCAGGEVQSQH